MKRKNPKYTHEFVDHDGKSRFYLRVPGRKRVPLPGFDSEREELGLIEAQLASRPAEVQQAAPSTPTQASEGNA